MGKVWKKGFGFVDYIEKKPILNKEKDGTTKKKSRKQRSANVTRISTDESPE